MTHNAINNDLWLTDEVRLLFNNFIEARRQFSMALIYHYADALYHSRHPQDKRMQTIKTKIIMGLLCILHQQPQQKKEQIQIIL